MATGDLTTLANVKEWLQLKSTITSDDALLTRLITATSQDFMRATKRPDLLAADYTEVHEGDGSRRMIAFHWPINSIALLKVNNIAIAASADKIAGGYYMDADIDPERMWNIYLVGYEFTDEAAVAISYNAGYVAVPGDIEQAVLDWIALRYKGIPNVGAMQRRSTEGETVQVPQVEAPQTTLDVIERYERCLPSVNRRHEMQERISKASAAKKR